MFKTKLPVAYIKHFLDTTKLDGHKKYFRGPAPECPAVASG